MNRSMRSTEHAPRRFRPLALVSRVAAVLLVGMLATQLAFAQGTDDQAGQPAKLIQQQMTPEQFSAAGLDQLNAGQLANLNAWLNRTLDVETTRAAEQAATQVREEVEDDNRGFMSISSDEPVTAQLQGQFNGFGKGREYRLDNGQVWRQTDNAKLVGADLDSPQVTINQSLFGTSWYLRVEGYNTRAKVERVE